MLKLLLVPLLIVAVSVLLLAVRLFFGRPFVSSHVEGNKALEMKGIHCAQAQDAEMRREHRTAVSEHAKH